MVNENRWSEESTPGWCCLPDAWLFNPMSSIRFCSGRTDMFYHLRRTGDQAMKTLVAALGALWFNDEPQPNAWGNPTALKIQYFASRRRFKAGSSIPGKQELDQDVLCSCYCLVLRRVTCAQSCPHALMRRRRSCPLLYCCTNAWFV